MTLAVKDIKTTGWGPQTINQHWSMDFDGNGYVDFFDGFEKSGGSGGSEDSRIAVAGTGTPTFVTAPTHVSYGTYVAKFQAATDVDQYYTDVFASAVSKANIAYRFYFKQNAAPEDNPRTFLQLRSDAVIEVYVGFLAASTAGDLICAIRDTDNNLTLTNLGQGYCDGNWHSCHIIWRKNAKGAVIIDAGTATSVCHTVATTKQVNIDRFDFGACNIPSNRGGVSIWMDDMCWREGTNHIGLDSSGNLMAVAVTGISGILGDGRTGTTLACNSATSIFTVQTANHGLSGVIPASVRVQGVFQQYSSDDDYQVEIGCTVDDSTYKYQWHSCTAVSKEVYAEFFRDPTGTSWSVTGGENLDDLGLVCRIDATGQGGTKCTGLAAKIIHGAAGDGFFSHGPRMISTEDSIVVTFRVQIVDTATPTETCVKVRYASGTTRQTVLQDPGSYVLNTDYFETTGVTTNTSTSDGFVTFTIDSLSSGTTYALDPIIQQADASWLSTWDFENNTAGNPAYTNCWECKTAPTDDDDTVDFRIGILADFHAGGSSLDGAESPLHYSLLKQLGDDKPDFVVFVGDCIHHSSADMETTGSERKNLLEAYKHQLGYHCGAIHLTENIACKYPLFETVSDHNFGINNPNKCGEGYYDTVTGVTYWATHDAVTVMRLSMARHPAMTAGDQQVVAAKGGDTDELQTDDHIQVTGTSGAYPGMVVFNKTDVAWGIVKTTSASNPKIITCLPLDDKGAPGNASFSNGDSIVIRRGGVWQKAQWGNCRLVLVDSRSKRDPDATPGADKLDGTVWGLVDNSLSKQLSAGGSIGDTLTAAASSTTSTIYHNYTGITDYVVVGDLVQNTSRVEYRCLYDAGGGLTEDSGVSWDNGDSLGWLTYENTGDSTLVIWYESGTTPEDNDVIKSGANSATLSANGSLRWSSHYGLVQSVTNSTGASDGTIVLEWAIPSQRAGDVIRLYECASSDWGSDTDNINHGHVQRTYVQAAIRDSDSDWTIVFNETPMHPYECAARDRWAEYDGLAFWDREKTWNVLTGTTCVYYATGFWEEPGLVVRHTEATGAYAAGLTKVTGNPTTRREWSYDSTEKRVLLYNGDRLTTNGADIYRNQHWLKCAIWRFIINQYSTDNMIWAAGDRHIAVLQRADSMIPWNSIGASPAHCNPDASHPSCRQWTVDGKDSWYERGDGTKVTDTNSIGCYGIIDIVNTDNKRATVTLYERDGTAITTTGGDDPLGTLTMNISFQSRLIDEGFEGPGYEEEWTEVIGS